MHGLEMPPVERALRISDVDESVRILGAKEVTPWLILSPGVNRSPKQRGDFGPSLMSSLVTNCQDIPRIGTLQAHS